MTSLICTVQQVLHEFVLTFIEHPYDSYTEHGQHAIFFADLIGRLSPDDRYTYWQDKRVSVVQKEYPTAGRLGKPRRQHWDIAVIKTPTQSNFGSYDYLRLAAAVEFGMNEAEAHLIDDIDRLCHPEANVDNGFIAHLYRLSRPGAQFSGRDWSANSRQIVTPDRIAKLTEDKAVTVYYAVHDETGRYRNDAYLIKDGSVSQIEPSLTRPP
jgi:hypothetical protein